MNAVAVTCHGKATARRQGLHTKNLNDVQTVQFCRLQPSVSSVRPRQPT
jgi:hypothetical protein